MELNLSRDVEESKRGFNKYISDKRETRENVGPLLNKVAGLVTHDRENAEVPNVFFASVFI